MQQLSQMSRSSINAMKLTNKKAFTLSETICVVVISLIILTAIMQVFVVINNDYGFSVSESHLQNCANNIMEKIVSYQDTPNGVGRLTEAVNFSIPNQNEIQFTDINGLERRFYTDSSNVYFGIDANPDPDSDSFVDQVIFTAPTNSTISLRFYEHTGAEYTTITLCIDAAVTKSLRGQALSGAVSTVLNIRNHRI